MRTLAFSYWQLAVSLWHLAHVEMRNFRNWEVWNQSKKLVKQAYLVTSGFPDSEKFGLVSQIRRASVSIPCNIAEGAGRKSEKELRHFLHNAMGSAFELETLFELSADVGFIEKDTEERLKSELTEIMKKLNSFISKLN